MTYWNIDQYRVMCSPGLVNRPYCKIVPLSSSYRSVLPALRRNFRRTSRPRSYTPYPTSCSAASACAERGVESLNEHALKRAGRGRPMSAVRATGARAERTGIRDAARAHLLSNGVRPPREEVASLSIRLTRNPSRKRPALSFFGESVFK